MYSISYCNKVGTRFFFLLVGLYMMINHLLRKKFNGKPKKLGSLPLVILDAIFLMIGIITFAVTMNSLRVSEVQFELKSSIAFYYLHKCSIYSVIASFCTVCLLWVTFFITYHRTLSFIVNKH